MRITIEPAENGYIIHSEVLGETGRPIVIAEPRNTFESAARLEAAVAMLGEVIDHFGLGGDAYDEERLFVGTRPGDAWEPPAGKVCAHRHVEHVEASERYDIEERWTCRCGRRFSPVDDGGDRLAPVED